MNSFGIVAKAIAFILLSFVIFPAKAQIDAGLHNSHYVYAGYTFAEKFNISLSHSIFAEKLSFQQIGLDASYKGSAGKFKYSGGISGATSWNGNYQFVAASAGLEYSPVGKLHLAASLSPRYDTGYGYDTCYSLGASFDIVQPVAVKASFTTIPDYRKSEKRVHFGFDFKVKQLFVSPVISLPTEGDQKFKTLRILVCINYHIALKKH